MAIRIDGTNTTANPGITGADTDTGLQVGTNELKLVTGGSEAVTVDSSQNVGIGTSGPSETLHVQSASLKKLLATNSDFDQSSNTGSSFDIGFGATSGNTYTDLRALTSGRSTWGDLILQRGGGNVGVGTDSPDNLLDVQGSSNPQLKVSATNTGTNSAGLYIENQGQRNWQIWADRASDQLRIGNNSRADTDITLTSVGNFLVGTTTANGAGGLSLKPNNSNGAGTIVFNRNNTTAVTYAIVFKNNGADVGSIRYTNTTTSYTSTSDYRVKENVVDITDAITRVKQLAPKRFNFIANPDIIFDGFLAHEAQTVVPEAVTGAHNEVDDDDNPVYQGIDQSKLVPLLTAALQEAIAKIETLETKVAALEAAS